MKNLSPLANEALTLFSQILEKERRKQKISQKELAERLGVARSTLQGILKGEPSIAIGKYFETAVILQVSLFTESRTEFLRLLEQNKETLSLLPSKVHSKDVNLDDNF
ncbi:MAG: helix-turn-helix transcriptional regulator [Leptospiraceae bacterium]|nr:helix-turn-helix transcriptional regulator [Leptospiraceae bacterium]MCP5499745.1 helix-turn-helix transcriptional regulator [Leptospiraceae bacterium]